MGLSGEGAGWGLRHPGQFPSWDPLALWLSFVCSLSEAVESWNLAFKAAGFEESVVRCVAKGDADWPEDYSRGDARFVEKAIGHGP